MNNGKIKEKIKSTEFKTLMDYAKEMHRRYFHAISAFYAYEALREAKAPNIIGKLKAEENAKIVSKYNNFFTPAQEALRIYFFLELAKMFGSSKKSLHIYKILNFIEGSMSRDELVIIKNMLNNHNAALKKLAIYRNKWLAHDDIEKPKLPSITKEEINKLFGVLAKILNSITNRLNSESWTYSHVENDVKYHTKLVIEHLQRFEPYRLKEIKGKKAYDKYDNYDAIEVPFTDAIPSDYEGVMGVPISFLDKYSPEQFEIIGMAEDNGKGFSGGIWDGKNPHCVINGENKFKRIFIKHKKVGK